MARIKFIARWFLRLQLILKNISVLKDEPFDFLLLAYDRKEYRKCIGQFLMQLDKFEKKKGESREIEVEMQIRYKERSLDQNELMWALYEIEEKNQNAGMVGSKDHMVDKMELYEADLDNWGEKDTVITEVRRLHYYLTKYRIVRYHCADGRIVKITDAEKRLLMSLDPQTKIRVQVTRGTSDYNTVEMARHIDGIFDRLSETVGINDVGDLKLYKENFELFKKKKGIK